MRAKPTLTLLLISLLIALTLAACSGAAPPQASSPTAAPPAAGASKAAAPATTTAPQSQAPAAPAQGKAAKVLKMARNAEPFSPFIPWQMDDNPAIFISVNIYDTLLRTTKDGMGVEAGLASKWEASADGLTWTFTLRDGLKFSDGTPVKGSDVVTSLNTCRSGEKAAWKDNYKAIKDIQAPDDKTIKITLSQPYAPLPAVMAMFPAAVLPADFAKASDAKDFNNETAYKTRGTGAYYIDGWKKGETLVLKRNPNYWGPQPDVDEIRIEYIPDDNTRILKLQGGEVDIIDFVPFSQVQTLGQQPGIKTQGFPIQQSEFVMLNNTRKPLDDLKVRQALNYATDKEAIIKSVHFGQAKFMNAPIPQGTYWDKNSQGYPFNLDKAKQLMAESSSPSGFKLEMQVRSNRSDWGQIAVILKDQWAKIGVQVDIQNLETNVARTNYREGNYMAQITAWTNDMNDPTQIVNYAMRGGPPSFAYWTRFEDKALAEKITQADLEQDAKKREQTYTEIQKTYLDAAPLVFIAYLNATAGWRDYVEGFQIEGMSYYRFENVKLNKK